mmetsp:Transcript_31752/g.75713  ORF Transcript_31752/g.75713 Transcript_31752/m.75713 type:complete len:218 (-) Transcript_31752:468-1121(-)
MSRLSKGDGGHIATHRGTHDPADGIKRRFEIPPIDPKALQVRHYDSAAPGRRAAASVIICWRIIIPSAISVAWLWVSATVASAAIIVIVLAPISATPAVSIVIAPSTIGGFSTLVIAFAVLIIVLVVLPSAVATLVVGFVVGLVIRLVVRRAIRLDILVVGLVVRLVILVVRLVIRLAVVGLVIRGGFVPCFASGSRPTVRLSTSTAIRIAALLPIA